METTHSRRRSAKKAPSAKQTETAARRLLQEAVNEPVARVLTERGAVFLCPHPPASPLAERLAAEANALADRDVAVVFCCRHRPDALNPAVVVHELGHSADESVVDQAKDFAERAQDALWRSPCAARHVVAFGSEWTSVFALERLGKTGTIATVLALDSLECQRSDMCSALNREIDAVEAEGLASSHRVLVADDEVAGHARRIVPSCDAKIRHACHPFPAGDFTSNLDPGEVKARYGIGPVDPTVLFVGEMTWRNGPDLVLRAMPALLRNHGQLRAVFVGDGDLQWPLRVQARYMLLEYAVRLLGDRRGRELHELIAASDIIVVPSRERTSDWQILAAWAARRPVVVTHEAAAGTCDHEQDAVLVYSNPGSVVWGVERVLYDSGLQGHLAERGRAKLDREHGWGAVASRLEAVMLELRAVGEDGPPTAGPPQPERR